MSDEDLFALVKRTNGLCSGMEFFLRRITVPIAISPLHYLLGP